MNYSKDQTDRFAEQTFAYLLLEEKDHVLNLRLNRAHKKNALNPVLMKELAFALSYARHQKSIRAVVLSAEGDVFCAGADLKAFMGQNEENNSTIPNPGKEILLGEIFQQVHKPTIALVEGHVFAGGFLILANCNYVVAETGLRFGLPEVKRGLFPFQVMASLMEVMPKRKVIDWCLRGYDLPVEQAVENGLVTHLAEKGAGQAMVDSLLSDLLENSPGAIRLGLQAYDEMRSIDATGHHKYLQQMLFRAIQSPDAREGIAAFKEKRKPVWPD